MQLTFPIDGDDTLSTQGDSALSTQGDATNLPNRQTKTGMKRTRLKED